MTPLHAPPDAGAIATDRWTAPFWSAARERRLVVCECARCGALRMPPGPFCARCQSGEIVWREVSGNGRLYSYTVVRQAIAPELRDCVPYAPAVIELDGAEGVRLVSAVVESAAETLAIGVRVALAWHALPSGDVLPFFRTVPATSTGESRG